jgi:cobalt-zinc-cadmium efflux system outer membrane protein
MHRFVYTSSLILIFNMGTILWSQNGFSDGLDVNTAVDIAIEKNPELKIYRHEVKALEAVKIQQGLKPNPELETEVENVLGNNDFTGFKGSEITAGFSQTILLAGKIHKRVRIAEWDITLAEWDYEARRLEIVTEVRKVFAQALSIQEQIFKNDDLIKISQEFINNLTKRVEAGKISPAEVARAQIILNSLEIRLSKLQSEYDTAISELKILLNDPGRSIESLTGSLSIPAAIPEYDSLLIKLSNHPKIKRFSQEYKKQKAVIDFERSKAIPDLTISAGYKRLNETKANAFVFGASIPIPIFDRNQGTIQEALIRYNQKTSLFQTVKNSLIMRLNGLYNRLKTLLNTFLKLQNESIPEAEKSFRIISQGNLEGRFSILDVLDAERTLFELQNQSLEVTADLNLTLIEIEGLTVTEIK